MCNAFVIPQTIKIFVFLTWFWAVAPWPMEGMDMGYSKYVWMDLALRCFGHLNLCPRLMRLLYAKTMKILVFFKMILGYS